MRPRLVWAIGVAVFVLASLAAIAVASALPLGYDSRAYWLAARHLVDGVRLYALPDAPLGQPDEFHYLPVVAGPFIPLLALPVRPATGVFPVEPNGGAAPRGDP